MLDALEALRPDDREVIRLAAWEDLGRDELAALLGCSPNAITKRLNRALDHLGAELGRAPPGAPTSSGEGGRRHDRS